MPPVFIDLYGALLETLQKKRGIFSERAGASKPPARLAQLISRPRCGGRDDFADGVIVVVRHKQAAGGIHRHAGGTI